MNDQSPFGHTLQVNGIDLHYEDRGEGEPLVLLHGFTGSTRDWRHVLDLEELGRTYRVLAVDMRGHGRSTNPAGAFSIRQCALDVLALLDHLGVDRFRALGMSLGAKALLHIATRQAARVSAMVLVSAAPYFPKQARELMRAQGSAARSDEEWRVMRLKHENGDDQIRALWKLAEGFAASYDDMTFTPPHLATIEARTLIVHGDRDPLYPVELALEMHRAIPRASLCVVPTGGHTPVFGDAKTQFALTALGFLGSAPAAG